LRALRANRYFCADEKRIRAEITVLDKSESTVGFLTMIVDSARMRFSSVRYRRSARMGRRPRKLFRCSSMCGPKSIDSDVASIARSARQPWFWYGCAFHPYQNHGY